MNDFKWSFLTGVMAAAFLAIYVGLEMGKRLMSVKAVVLHGSVYPDSRVTNVVALLVLLSGVVASVSFGMLILIRGYGRRASGAMLRETNSNALRGGMPGMESLKEDLTR